MSNEAKRVFVVDDDLLVARTLGLILQKNGIDATYFTRPVDALASAAIEAPSLVVSDISMPGMSGFELVSKLEVSCPECKVILLSGRANMLNCFEMEQVQGLQILAKPIPPQILISEVRAQL